MRFGMVGRMGPGMRQVVRSGRQSTGGGNFRDECGAPHCNQWGICDVAVRELLEELQFRVVRGVDRRTGAATRSVPKYCYAFFRPTVGEALSDAAIRPSVCHMPLAHNDPS